jgi:hypothetical protein
MQVAAFWVSAFWIGLTSGRVLAGALAGALRPVVLVRIALAALGQSLLSAALGLLAGAFGLELIGPSLALAALALALIVRSVWRSAPAHSGASTPSSARRTLARAL